MPSGWWDKPVGGPKPLFGTIEIRKKNPLMPGSLLS